MSKEGETVRHLVKKKYWNWLLSHFCVAVLVTVGCAYWLPVKQQPTSQTVHKKQYKVALLQSETVFYHRKAAEGFHEQIKKSDNIHVVEYTITSLDQIVVRQIIDKVLSEKPDVIVPIGSVLSTALVGVMRSRDMKTPVVFVGASDPVELGLVDALARPGHNVTGTATSGHHGMLPFELLRYLKPDVKNIVIPYYSGGVASRSEVVIAQIRAYLGRYGVHVEGLAIDALGDAVSRLKGVLDRFDTVSYLEGDLVRDAHVGFIQLCRRYKKTFYPLELEPIEEGAMIVYGVQPALPGKAAARYVEHILHRNAHPSHLPVLLLEDSRRLLVNCSRTNEQGLKIDPIVVKLIERASLYSNPAQLSAVSAGV